MGWVRFFSSRAVLSFIAVVGFGSVVACGGASDDPTQSGGDQAATASAASSAKKFVGTWKYDESADTDSMAEWINEVTFKEDKSFTASFGGNVCDPDNCEAGVISADGTFSIDGSNVAFKYTYKGSDGKEHSTTDKFGFSFSGESLKMHASSDRASTGIFTLKKE